MIMMMIIYKHLQANKYFYNFVIINKIIENRKQGSLKSPVFHKSPVKSPVSFLDHYALISIISHIYPYDNYGKV